MAAISVGSAVGAGFQLIVRRPFSVLTWGIVRVGFALAVLTLYAPMWMGMMSEVHTMAHHMAPGAHASRGEMMAMALRLRGLHDHIPYYAAYWLPLVQLLVGSMILCAATRAIVHPRQAVLAYLRIGTAELFVALVMLLAAVAAIVAAVAFGFGLGHLVAFMNAQHMGASGRYVALAVALIYLAAIIYVLLRFAFVTQMMVDDGGFHLFGSWGRTRGRVGSLFLIGLSLFVIALIVEALLWALFGALGLGAVRAAGGPAGLAKLLQQPPSVMFAKLQPWVLVICGLAVVIDGCVTAIFVAPWARAYRDVVPPTRRGPLILSDGPPPPEPQPPESPPPSDFPERLDHEPPAAAETLAPAMPDAETHDGQASTAPEVIALPDSGPAEPPAATEPGQAEHVAAIVPEAPARAPEPEPLRLIEPLRLNPPIAESGDEPARGI